MKQRVETALEAGAKLTAERKPKELDGKRSTADRWEKLRKDAAQLGEGLYGILLYVDGLIAAKGFPPMSAWWRFTIRRFWQSGKRWLWVRGGRGIGKSTNLARIAVVECLFGDHSWLGPGEAGIWPLMSVDMDESNLKVGVVCAMLEVLGIEYEKYVRQLGRTRILFQDATGKDIEIRVYPATVTAASGPTLGGFTGDELAKWKNDKDKGTNSADEVIDTIAPAFRARPGTHGYCVSSAWMQEGIHYEMIEAGETDNNCIACIGEEFIEQVKRDLWTVCDNEKVEANRLILEAYIVKLKADSSNVPTWLGNPSISALATRKEARTFDTWMREAVSRSSGAAEECFFDGVKLHQATDKFRPNRPPDAIGAAIDPASMQNAFALAVVGRWENEIHDENGSHPLYAPICLREWTPSEGMPLDVDRITLPEAAKLCVVHGAASWKTDVANLSSAILRGSEAGLSTVVSGPDIFEDEYKPCRDELHRGHIALTGCEGVSELARQLTLVREVFRDGKRKIVIVSEKGKTTEVHGDMGRAFVRALTMVDIGKDRIFIGPRLLSSVGRYGRPRR
jgi:hypothetical protein